MEDSSKNLLVPVAMQIILHAGNARLKMSDALEHAKKFDFSMIDKQIADAEKEIVLAHKAQTEVIQREASGEEIPVSLLFIHAQDTLMTIDSEIRLSKTLIDTLKIIARMTPDTQQK